jgi:hypothetical protein
MPIGQCASDREPDAATRAGDDRHGSVEVHRVIL